MTVMKMFEGVVTGADRFHAVKLKHFGGHAEPEVI